MQLGSSPMYHEKFTGLGTNWANLCIFIVHLCNMLYISCRVGSSLCIVGSSHDNKANVSRSSFMQQKEGQVQLLQHVSLLMQNKTNIYSKSISLPQTLRSVKISQSTCEITNATSALTFFTFDLMHQQVRSFKQHEQSLCNLLQYVSSLRQSWMLCFCLFKIWLILPHWSVSIICNNFKISPRDHFYSIACTSVLHQKS
jgi:hypothetical protein